MDDLAVQNLFGSSNPRLAALLPDQRIFDDATYGFYEQRNLPTLGSRLKNRPPSVATLVAPAALPPEKKFKIVLLTRRYAPNHRVTLRNNIDGWTRDIFGAYAYGGWIFELSRDNYPGSLAFKFLLDDSYWMDGFDRTVANGTDHNFTDDPARDPWVINPAVTFPEAPARYLHGYENLRTSESPLQQERFLGNHKEEIYYDVIVIGSGIGGGILADALSDLGINTLVLELGSLHSTTHLSGVFFDWSDIVWRHQVGHYERVDGTNFLFGAQMAMGGRSLYWSGIILRMQTWELPYWPAAITTYLTGDGYARAEQLMRKQKTLGTFQERVLTRLRGQLPDLRIEDLPRSLHQPNLNPQNSIDSVLFSSTGVFSTADLLSDSVSTYGRGGSNYLNLNLNHLVTELRPDPVNPGRIAEVVCEDLIGNRRRIYRGRVVVLAAGSIESPKLFLNSQLDDPSGKAGVGLTDHPYLFSDSYALPRDNPLWGDNNHAKVLLAAGDASRTNYPFYTELLINPKYWHVRYADDDLWQTLPDSERQTQVTLKFGFPNELAEGNWVRGQGPGKRAQIRVGNLFIGDAQRDQARQFRNRVLDALGIPLNSQQRNQPMWLAEHGGTVNHAGGTLRIGPPGVGVVDEDLKFHAYENLYAADVSVFPYLPTANPSLTLAALAQRLAAHLQAQLA